LSHLHQKMPHIAYVGWAFHILLGWSSWILFGREGMTSPRRKV
jgi:hypothetical protein